jgi:lipopolysaccharide biosynthesis protein
MGIKQWLRRRQQQQAWQIDRHQGAAFDMRAAVRETHTGDIAPNSRATLCLLAHYDPDGWIDPYVQYAIRHYAEDLHAEVVLISTSPCLHPDHVQQVTPWVRQIVRRDNHGIDFGSWRTAMALVPDWQTAYQTVVLTNDSVYGPLFPVDPLFAQMQTHPVWGMTDSWQQAYHVQSYFWVFKQPILASQAMRDFWDGFCFYRDKRRIIAEYEVGFTQHWLTQHVVPAAVFPYRETRRLALQQQPPDPAHNTLAYNQPMNPTHALWDTLIMQQHYPFIKRDLLQTDLHQRYGAHQWEAVIQAAGSAYDTTLIEHHLMRNTRKLPV